jgi:hypothetical protein
MYWYLKNLHNETISQNNLDEISRNFAKESTTKFRGISRNFAKFREIKITFVVISYFATTLAMVGLVYAKLLNADVLGSSEYLLVLLKILDW